MVFNCKAFIGEIKLERLEPDGGGMYEIKISSIELISMIVLAMINSEEIGVNSIKVLNLIVEGFFLEEIEFGITQPE